MAVVDFLKQIFKRSPITEYFTVDGHHLAPYPDMIDDDLMYFENDLDVKPRTFPNGR